MATNALNYLTNLLRLLLGSDERLKPLVVSYCVTTQCNLNCRYCEDFGARRNAEQPPPLPLSQAQRLLAIIRQTTDSLIFTGGEPLLYPDLETLVSYARHALHFRNLTLISNGALLDRYRDRHLLDHIDRLIISLDSVDTELWQATLRTEPGTAAHILANIRQAARQQREKKVRIVIHCVITPTTLSNAKEVLNFCMEHGLIFSFSPQSVNNWPHYDLLTSDAYREFVSDVIQSKQRGAPILGSLPYLRTMYTFETYACYPLLAPRVMSDGTLSYPCRPIERNQDEHGGRSVNLLEVGSWQAAVAQARADYGDPPTTCSSCYQQCYVEPSLMQSHPLALLWELIRFSPSRQARVHTYAPG